MPSGAGRAASGSVLDVTDFASVQRLVDEVAAEHGRLDFMFNNAGIGVGGELRDHTIAAWNRIIDVNVRGAFFTAQAAADAPSRAGIRDGPVRRGACSREWS